MCNLNKILHALNNSVDTDDVICIGEEIEATCPMESIAVVGQILKEMLNTKDISYVNALHIKCLLNYLLVHNERIDNYQ